MRPCIICEDIVDINKPYQYSYRWCAYTCENCMRHPDPRDEVHMV